MRVVPRRIGTANDRAARRSSEQICHLRERVKLAVLMYRSANEPCVSSVDVRLNPVEALVEAKSHEILCVAERKILPVDDRHGQSRTRTARSLNASDVGKPEPEPVRV